LRQPRILMCPPDFYGIEYEINPWMSRSRGSMPDRARSQWQHLYDTLMGLGVQVEPRLVGRRDLALHAGQLARHQVERGLLHREPAREVLLTGEIDVREQARVRGERAARAHAPFA